ncbi:MAG TPA: GNAT family N-acetyltransferase [Chitinophagales bacterium]|nr:GNAT family N-acetyltransferase [Chitinophagales bacterium]
MLLEIRKYNEFELTEDIQQQIALLLQKCFPDTAYHGRHYFKQLPHFRFLAYEDEMLVGHVGIDYRIMRLNGQPVKVTGIIELCVVEERRHHYIGSFLLEEVEKLAKNANADFILLFSKVGSVYIKHNFRYVDNICTWLKIHEHKSIGIGDEFIQNEIMVKEISGIKWETGNLDMLGYLY